MAHDTDRTHDQTLRSWVESANAPDADFPIQNLPLCMFRRAGADPGSERLGTAIGDMVVDLDALAGRGLLPLSPEDPKPDLRGPATLFRLGRAGVRTMRQRLSDLFDADTPAVRDDPRLREEAMTPIDGVAFGLPTGPVGDYTDFYASVFHATNVGSMFRPDNPLLPNYKHVPIAYHGRASTIVPSGTDVVRPWGQKAPTQDGASPGFAPAALFDYELEVGIVIGRGNPMGTPIDIARAEEHVLGLCLVNDWSARDLQKWEYQPLGPFLAKNFATTVSPFLVTMDALAPFRTQAYARPEGDPQPLDYLDSPENRAGGGIDIALEVHLASSQMRDRGMSPVLISAGGFAEMYWTVAQMVTHHAVNGCALRPGDLLASGTVSGPGRASRGCLLERTWDGDAFATPPALVPGTQRTPIELPTGERRTFLEDGDEVVLSGACARPGFRRIGFGTCRGIVRPAPNVR